MILKVAIVQNLSQVHLLSKVIFELVLNRSFVLFLSRVIQANLNLDVMRPKLVSVGLDLVLLKTLQDPTKPIKEISQSIIPREALMNLNHALLHHWVNPRDIIGGVLLKE